MLTRDSAIWILAIVGALLTYLAQVGTSPLAWPYTEWVKFISFAVATLAGKLATSPLQSKREQEQDTWDLKRRPLDRD